jgi:glycosyltransferase involved in cell wall biosynthesis
MDRPAMRRHLQIQPDSLVVLFVGNLIKEKGLGELVAAFKQLKERVAQAQLVLIGSGPFRAAAEQSAAAFGIGDAVMFLGAQPLTTIAQWMNAASVLCLPSYMEGVPNVVLEALACETPVVATNVGGIPELDKGNGMLKLVSPQDSQALAQALLTLKDDAYADGTDVVVTSWQENAASVYTMCTDAVDLHGRN